MDQTMFSRAGIFALAAIAVLFVDAIAAKSMAAEDCTLKQLASVPIQRMADGAIAVPIKIAGVEEKFLLSLDAPFSEILPDVADALKLRSGSLGKTSYIIPALELGSAQGSDFFFYTLPPTEASHGAAGILGLDVLSHFDLEVDLKRNTLNLFSPDHCPGQGVYWAKSAAEIPFKLAAPFGRVVLNAELDGKPIAIGMPGASQIHTITSTGVLSEVFGIAADSPDLKPAAGSNPRVLRYPFKSLSIGGIVMNNPAIDIVKSDGDLLCGDVWVSSKMKRCSGGTQMQLGLDKFETLRLYFSFSDGVLYATAADATVKSEAQPISK